MHLNPELADELVRSRRDEILRDRKTPEPRTIVLPADDDEESAEVAAAPGAVPGRA